MKIDRARLDALTLAPSYQALPMAMALESGYGVWWAQVGHMTKTAAQMAIWEVGTALESCFETYAGLGLEIRLRFTQPKDMDPAGRKVEMLVNGRFYQSHSNEIEKTLSGKIERVDGFRALNLVESTATMGIITNRLLIAEALNEAFPHHMTNVDQARAAKRSFAPEVSARIEAILMGQDTPSNQPSRPAARM